MSSNLLRAGANAFEDWEEWEEKIMHVKVASVSKNFDGSVVVELELLEGPNAFESIEIDLRRF